MRLRKIASHETQVLCRQYMYWEDDGYNNLFIAHTNAQKYTRRIAKPWDQMILISLHI